MKQGASRLEGRCNTVSICRRHDLRKWSIEKSKKKNPQNKPIGTYKQVQQGCRIQDQYAKPTVFQYTNHKQSKS